MNFQPRILSSGHVCCSNEDDNPEYFCETCKAEFAEQNRVRGFAPPDPYAAGIRVLRAANATTQSTFEEQFVAERLKDLEAEHQRFIAAADKDADERRMRAAAADDHPYAPVDPYRKALEERRRMEWKR